MQRKYLFAAGLVCLAATSVRADVTAFVGARIHPVGSEPVEDGVLVIEDDRIRSIGPRSSVRIPGGARVVDVSGQVIIPGLVDTHSHVGEVAGADASAPIQPEVRVLDSINVRDAGFKRARAGGLTSLNIMPGSGHLVSGQTIYVKLREGATIEELAYRRDDGEIAGGLKMANGTNPLDEQPFPGTRAKSAALVRQAYIEAQAYRDKLARSDRDDAGRPERDLGKEALVEVLEGKRAVHHHTHRHDDIVTALRLREEFGYRLVLQHVSEAFKVGDEIAAAGVPVSLILVDSPGGKLETMDLEYRSPALMEQKGIDTAFHTDDYITDSRFFLRMAAFGVRAGMSREAALEALTLAGARMLDIDERAGSLERGKDADFVILSGDPFSVYTRVLETWVEGRRVFDLDDPEDAAIAEGGFGVLNPSGSQHIHGLGEAR
jgi:imidazolonepropionase-like amidohydrolase